MTYPAVDLFAVPTHCSGAYSVAFGKLPLVHPEVDSASAYAAHMDHFLQSHDPAYLSIGWHANSFFVSIKTIIQGKKLLNHLQAASDNARNLHGVVQRLKFFMAWCSCQQ